MIIAQITDLHVQADGDRAYGVVDTNPLVERAIAHLNTLNPQPDVVVATGDLVHRGQLREYQQLRTILTELRHPIYLLPGNHDHRATLKAVFADHAYLPTQTEHLSYVIESYPVRMIMLDTVIPGEGGGLIDSERLSWLEAQLVAAPKTPTIIFMHHPPFLTGIAMMDQIGLQGGEALAELIVHHSQIERVSCGHLHRTIYRRWAGTVASTQPSLAHQVALDLQPESVGQFVMEPPAYQVHVWSNDSLVSHSVFVDQFEGPYRFSNEEFG